MEGSVHWKNVQGLVHTLVQYTATTEPSPHALDQIRLKCDEILRECHSLRQAQQIRPEYFSDAPHKGHYATIDSIAPASFSRGGTTFADVHSPHPYIPVAAPYVSAPLPTETLEPSAPASGEKRCYICNEHQTPEWRKGPTGKKTLCNACGINYSKKEQNERYRLRESGYSDDKIDNIMQSIKDSMAQQVFAERQALKQKKR